MPITLLLQFPKYIQQQKAGRSIVPLANDVFGKPAVILLELFSLLQDIPPPAYQHSYRMMNKARFQT